VKFVTRYIAVYVVMVAIFAATLSIVYFVGISESDWWISGSCILFLIFLDHMTTLWVLRNGGRESNPLARFVQRRYGDTATSLSMMAGSFAFVGFFWRIIPDEVCWAMVAAYTIVPINNLLVVRKIWKRKEI